METIFILRRNRNIANNVDLVDFLYRQGEKLIASGRESGLNQTGITVTVATNGMITQKRVAVMP